MPFFDRLNNGFTGPTTDYSDNLTVIFSYPRSGFSLAVFNAGVYYQLAFMGLSGRDYQWEIGEHFLAPSFNSFNNPDHEGIPPGSRFSGIRIRSAIVNTPARVIVT